MPEQSVPPIEFRDPRRARLHEQLATLGPGPLALFRDACRVFDGLIVAETSWHLAGHLQRELLSAVQSIMLPAGYREPRAGDDPAAVDAVLRAVGNPANPNRVKLQRTLREHFKPQRGSGVKKVHAIAEALGLTVDHEIVRLFAELNLHGIAHRANLDAPPPLESALDTWERFQRLLSLLLDHFEKSYAAAYGKIRSAIATKDLNTFRTAVPQNSATLAYFFEHVGDGDAWFEILRKSDLITIPPHGGGWPALAYLQRLAPAHPTEVRDILLAVKPTDNEFVLMGMIDVAQRLSADDAVQALQRILPDVIRLRSDSYVARDLADAAAVYAEKQPSAVLELLLPFVELSMPTETTNDSQLGSRELAARVDLHTYGDIVNGALQTVTAVDPALALPRLAEMLEAALRAKFDDGGDTYSSAWRSAIEPHEQNHHFEPLPHLLDAVRFAAERACAAHPDRAAELVRDLMNRPWQIFRRLGLHLLRVSLPPTHPTVRDVVVDPATIHAIDSRHESHLLITQAFPHLDIDAQEQVIAAILAGPIDAEEQEPDRIARWKVLRLSWIEEHLPSSARSEYERLRGNAAPPNESADFDFYTTGLWVGPTSPMAAGDLARMTVDELRAFLQTWTPSGGLMVATREGLGRDLAAIVAQRAAEFSASAESLMGLDATYIRSILSGFTEAARNGAVLAWEPVLRLAVWAVSQPREISGRDRQGLDDDPHWGWTRSQIGRLLQQGFFLRPSQIPLALRRLVWEVLAPLTDDPDPDTDRDTTMDPLTTAINSTRGVAFEALFGYAAWVRGGRFRLPDVEGPAFHDMPEVASVLERHLNPALEPSAAIRAVYGQHLFYIHLMAPAWVREHLGALFPASPQLLADAVWQTYFVAGQHISPEISRELDSQYARAVDAIGGAKPLYREYLNHLAYQLLYRYLRGDDGLEEGSLLDRFFRSADDETRTHTVGLVPHILSADTTPAEVNAWRERAMAFWAWRVASSPRSADLRGFGLWVSCPAFEATWRLQQLELAVTQAGVPVHEHAVIDALPALAHEHPQLALAAIDALIQNAATYMELYRLTYRGEIESILREGLASDDAMVSASARELTNSLIAKGFTSLLGLLE